jgi:5-epimerase
VTVRELAVPGAFELTPWTHRDSRGTVAVPVHADDLLAATGRSWFTVRQTILSSTARGGVRGVHYTATPPGLAKVVQCPVGRVTDIVVDLRVGSPSFGRWDAVSLDARTLNAVYLPVGVGHAFVAEQDDSLVSYLMTGTYRAETERTVSVRDPVLALPLPATIRLSERDRLAPTLAAAAAAGDLPGYAEALAAERDLDLAPGHEPASSAGPVAVPRVGP